MTNYNDGKWHGWNGGECPVHLHSEVEIAWRHKDGTIDNRGGKAGSLSFLGNEYGDIIAFRVTKEHREPREFWVTGDGANVWHTEIEARRCAEGGEIIHVREVMPDE